MQVLFARCAGLDVHSRNVMACTRIAEGSRVVYEKRRFGTTTSALLELADWLEAAGVTHVAMESTGVYWRPIWHILAERFELVLANATQVKNVPGRKSDVSDAQWLSDLLAHGLIRGSFVPPPETEQARDLTRTRRQLVGEISRHKQRILKTLEDANLKPGSAISDVFGLSGRRILAAIVAGETDPERLADQALGRLKAPRAVVVETLRGRITEHHRFMIRLHLEQIDALQDAVRTLDERINTLPFRDIRRRLVTTPGISAVAANTILAELGSDMSRFPSAAHAVSWTGLCPRSDESAGKKLSTRLRPGNRWLRSMLIQCAGPAASKKGCYFGSQRNRIAARRGAKKARAAVAASLLTVAYHIIRDGTTYAELGSDHFERRNKNAVATRLVARLRRMGYEVAVQPAA